MLRPYSITINNYNRNTIPDTVRESLNNLIRTHLTALRSLKTLDFYDLKGNRHNHKASTTERFIIFVDTTLESYSQNDLTLERPASMFGIENNILKLHTVEGNGITIVTDEGYIVAEYFHEGERANTLNIAFNMLDGFDANMKLIFGKILDVVNAEHEKELIRFQWNPANRQRIVEEVREKMKAFEASAKHDAQRKFTEAESRAKQYKEEFIKYVRQAIRFQADMDKFNQLDGKVVDKYIKDLDLIAAMPKVREVRVENGVVHMFTNDIYTYADNDKRYYTGKFHVEFNPENASVKFFGDTPRQGYWTQHDPHPHISGDSGNACLGNIDATIAELSSQYEIYALANVLIDFLESANTSDSAGKNVVRWDEVDANGTIIARTTNTCPCCEHEMDYTLTECGVSGDMICNDCRRQVITIGGAYAWVSEDNLGEYGWNEDHDVYVHDEFSGDIAEVIANV